MNQEDITTVQPGTPLPTWMTLPENLQNASVKVLVERYSYLSEMKLAAERWAGQQPYDLNQPESIALDPLVREVVQAGLRATVQEMTAVSHALNHIPGGFKAVLTGEVDEESGSLVWVASRYVIDGNEYDVVGNREPDGYVWFEVYAPDGGCISEDNPEQMPTEQQVRGYIATGYHD